MCLEKSGADSALLSTQVVIGSVIGSLIVFFLVAVVFKADSISTGVSVMGAIIIGPILNRLIRSWR